MPSLRPPNRRLSLFVVAAAHVGPLLAATHLPWDVGALVVLYWIELGVVVLLSLADRALGTESLAVETDDRTIRLVYAPEIEPIADALGAPRETEELRENGETPAVR